MAKASRNTIQLTPPTPADGRNCWLELGYIDYNPRLGISDGLFGPDAVIGPWGFPGYRPPPDRLVPFTPPDVSGPLPGWATPPSIDTDPDLSGYTRPELPSLDVDAGGGTRIPAPGDRSNLWDVPIPGPARPPELDFIDSLYETGGDPPTPYLVPRRVRRRGTATVESESDPEKEAQERREALGVSRVAGTGVEGDVEFVDGEIRQIQNRGEAASAYQKGQQAKHEAEARRILIDLAIDSLITIVSGGFGGVKRAGGRKLARAAANRSGRSVTRKTVKTISQESKRLLHDETGGISFRRKLMKHTGKSKSDVTGMDAHHVFPKKYENLFKDVGIDVHDPKMGAWWESSAHKRYSRSYNLDWEIFFRKGGKNAVKYAKRLSRKYGFKWK